MFCKSFSQKTKRDCLQVAYRR